MPILGALIGLLLLAGSVPSLSNATFSVAMTGYNAVPAQTDSTPFITASGAYSNPQTIAARSPDLATELPFGTVIEIDGPSQSQDSCGYNAVQSVIGYRIIEDSMAPQFTDRIDILLGTQKNYLTSDGLKNAAQVLGICNDVSIHILGRIDPQIKLPQTQAELAALIEHTPGLALK